ncbi:MAG TPA: type 4a pilus biogenesis protein PilO [Nitrospiraceae bacterium]|nr:type 4a pilus biogenesis protein PilO [Nitrospiraceae bacterium]
MTLMKLPIPQIPRPALYGLIPLIAFVVVGISCVLGSYWLVLEPSRLRVDKLRTAYEEAGLAHEQRIAAKRVQALVLDSQRDLEKIWETLPTQSQFPALAVAISQFGKHLRVSIPGMRYSTEPSKTGLAVEGSLQFRAVGEYANIYRFIHRLETAQSYLVIESLDVTSSRGQTGAGKSLVELNVRVVTFLRPDPSRQGES